MCEGSSTVLSDYHICRYDPILGVIVAVGDDCDVVVFGRNLCRRRIPVRRGVHWLDCFLYAGSSSILLLSSEVLECVNYHSGVTTNTLVAEEPGEGIRENAAFLSSSYLTCLHIPQGLTCGAVGRRSGIVSYFRFCDTKHQTQELFWTVKETNVLQLAAPFIPKEDLSGDKRIGLSPQFKAMLRGPMLSNDEKKEGGVLSSFKGISDPSVDSNGGVEEEVFFPLGSVVSLDSFPENPNSLIGVVAGIPGVVEWTVDKGKAVTFFSAGNSPCLSLKENIIVTCKVTPGGHYVVATTSDSSQVFLWKTRGSKKKSSDICVEVYWVVDLSTSIGHDLSQNTVEAFQYNEYRIGMYMARASPRQLAHRNKEMDKEDGPAMSSTSSLTSSVVLTDKHSQLFLLINGQRDILEVVLQVEEKIVVDQEQVITDLNVYTARKGGVSGGFKGRSSSTPEPARPSSHWDPSLHRSSPSSSTMGRPRSTSRGNLTDNTALAANFFKVFHVEPCSPRCYWNSELTDTDLDSLIITSCGGLQPLVVKRKQFEQGLQSIQELREIPGDAPWHSSALVLHLPQREKEITLRKLAEMMTSSIYFSTAHSMRNALPPHSLSSPVTGAPSLPSRGSSGSNAKSSSCSTLDELVFGGGNLLELYLPLLRNGHTAPAVMEKSGDEVQCLSSEQEMTSPSSLKGGTSSELSPTEHRRWRQRIAEEVTLATVVGWGSAVLLSPSTAQILRVDPSALRQCPLWNSMGDTASPIILELALPPSSSGLPAELILRVVAYEDQLLVTKYHIRQRVGRTALVLDRKRFRLPGSHTGNTEWGAGTTNPSTLEDAWPSSVPAIRFTLLVEARIWLAHLHSIFRFRAEGNSYSGPPLGVASESHNFDAPLSSPEFFPDGKCLMIVLEDSSFVLVDVSGEVVTGPHEFVFTSTVNGISWKVTKDEHTETNSGPIQLLFPVSQFLHGISQKAKMISAKAFWGSTPTFPSEALHLVALLEETQTAKRLLLIWNFKTMKRQFYSLPCSPLSAGITTLTSHERSPSPSSNSEFMEGYEGDGKGPLPPLADGNRSSEVTERESLLRSTLHLAGTLATNSPNMTGDVKMFSVDLSVSHPPSGPGSECGEVTLSDAAGGFLYRIQIGFGMSAEASHEWCMRVTPLNDFANTKHYQQLSQWSSLGFPLNIKRIRLSGTLEAPEESDTSDNSYTATTMFWRCVCVEEDNRRETLQTSSTPGNGKDITGNGETYEILLRGAISYCQTSWPFGAAVLYTQTTEQHIPKRQMLLNPQRTPNGLRFAKLASCAPLVVVVHLQQIISINVGALIREEAEGYSRSTGGESKGETGELTPSSLEMEKYKGTVRTIQLASTSAVSRWIDDVVVAPALHALLAVTRDTNGWRWIHVADECTLASRMPPYPTLDFVGEDRIKILLLKEDNEGIEQPFESENNHSGAMSEGWLPGSSGTTSVSPSSIGARDRFSSTNSNVIAQLYIVGASTGIMGHYRIRHGYRGDADSMSLEGGTLSGSGGHHTRTVIGSGVETFPYLRDPFWPSHCKPLPSSFRRYRVFLPRRPTQKAESNFFKRLMSAPWEDIAEQLVNNTFLHVRRGGSEGSTDAKGIQESSGGKTMLQDVIRQQEKRNSGTTETMTLVHTSSNPSAVAPASSSSTPLKFMPSHVPSTLRIGTTVSGETHVPRSNRKTDVEATSMNKLSAPEAFAAKGKAEPASEARGYRYMQLKAVAQKENVTLQEARRMMGENVRKLQERGERLEAVSSKSAQLASQALTFQDLARQLKEKQKNSWL